MEKNKNLTIEETFNLAIKNHQEGKTDIAQNLYNKILEIDPNHSQTLNNIGTIFTNLKENQKAKECFEKAIKINPNYAEAHNNLGIIFEKLGDLQKAKECYEKAIELNPNYADAYYNIGIIFKELGNLQKAKDCYKKTIEIDPNHSSSHNNLGVIFKELGNLQKAKACYEKAIEINPNYVNALNNFGNIFQQLGENQKAISYYKKAIKINPNHVDTHWNLHGHSSNIDEALLILKKIYKINSSHIKSKIMISALEGYKGNFKTFNELLNSSHLNHPYVRSIKWVFSLPKLPEIFFNRWLFFDAVIKLADNSRPFFEFGVWNGVSFQYLINTFKIGFGFDTFSGLPEAWQEKPKGAYSSFGVIPKIEGGEFIVGKFEDTLPIFFSEEKPKASLINFDADLYSSTLCALNNSNKVIDEKTILVFDEFIINDKWEEDEFKALNEFCDNLGYNYEVIAVSFFTKQVAIKLKKK